MENFGSIVTEQLEDRGITQKELAREIGISAPYLNDILNNRRQAPAQKERIKAYLANKGGSL